MADSAFHVEMRSDSLILESQSDATTRRDEHDAASVNSHQRFGMEQSADPGRVDRLHGLDMNGHVAAPRQFDGSHRINHRTAPAASSDPTRRMTTRSLGR